MKNIICLLVSLMCACNPITFHKESVVDFTQYQRVYVDLEESDSLNRYIKEQLQQSSGFSEVVDAEQDADAILKITLTYNLEADPDDEFINVNVSFELYSATGDRIDQGEYSASSLGYSEAKEDALDEVVNHYLGSYAI